MDLFEAAERNNLEELKKGITEGLDVNANLFGWTPLHKAAIFGNGDCVELLLNAGARPDEKSKYGITPLQLASQNGTSTKAIQALLRYGADVNIFDKENNTPLHMAARNSGGHGGCVQALLQGGADYILQNNEGKTAEDLTPEGNKKNVLRDHRIAQEQKALQEVPMPENLPERHTPRIGRGRL